MYCNIKVYDERRLVEMNRMRKVEVLILTFLILLLLVNCNSDSNKSSTTDQISNQDINAPTKEQSNDQTKNNLTAQSIEQSDNLTEEQPNINADHEFIQEDYGFAFNYNLLALDDTIKGDRFAELSYISGDTAVVFIQEPSDLIESPEEWINDKDRRAGEYKVYRNDNVMFGKYPGYILEYGWNVMGQDIRTIDLKALKDGYFYDLIVTMKEENVEDSRTQYDVVVDSFRLLDNVVDFEVLMPWKDAIGDGYPYDTVPLYMIKEVDYVFGKPFSETGNITVAYYPKDTLTLDTADTFYSDLLMNSKDYHHVTVDKDKEIQIEGTIENYAVQVKLTNHAVVEVNIKIKKID